MVATDQRLDGKARDTTLLHTNEMAQLFLQRDGHLTGDCRCSTPGLSVGPLDELHTAVESVGMNSEAV